MSYLAVILKKILYLMAAELLDGAKNKVTEKARGGSGSDSTAQSVKAQGFEEQIASAAIAAGKNAVAAHKEKKQLKAAGEGSVAKKVDAF